MEEGKYDKEIRKAAEENHIPFLLLKAQVWQESKFDSYALSPCGARGLLQLMPSTAREMGLDTHEANEVQKNLSAGAKYLSIQYVHFPEIEIEEERWKHSLAAYNGGRGYINFALKMAYGLDRMKPKTWAFTSRWLPENSCDVKQITEYVDKIWEKYITYTTNEEI